MVSLLPVSRLSASSLLEFVGTPRSCIAQWLSHAAGWPAYPLSACPEPVAQAVRDAIAAAGDDHLRTLFQAYTRDAVDNYRRRTLGVHARPMLE